MNDQPTTGSELGSRNVDLGPRVLESIHVPWYGSLRQQVGELMEKKEPLPPLPKYRDPEPGERGMGPLVIDEKRRLPTQLVEANLQRADLRGADLAQAVLDRADLSGARLDGADLAGASMEMIRDDSADPTVA